LGSNQERADVWSRIGLSARDAEVYEALLASDAARTGCLPVLPDYTPDDVRCAIEALVDAGLVRRSQDHVEAVRPDAALERLLAQSHEQLATTVERLAAAHREVSRLTEAFEEAQTRSHPEYIEVIEGIDAIQHRLSELAALTRRELLLLTDAADASLAEASAPLFDANRSLSSRSVSLRTIMPDAVADDPQGWAYAETLASLGDQIRTCPVVPILANISDRSAAMVPLDLRDTQAGALFVRSPALIASLVSLFELLWDAGTPITGRPAADIDIDVVDRRLLQLLNLGAKDEHVARACGMSVRSVRARVARLMTMTGSRSRFQLATAAARRGWIAVAEDHPAASSDRD
jgi:DNA-binding CsgD family transcriptional regulator/predicted transcriptional regulator